MRELSTRGAFLAWFLDVGQFTPHEREYYVEVCDAARCGIRDIACLPLERRRDAAELRPASRRREILLHRSPSHPVAGCRAEGMTHLEDEQIPSAVTISSPQGRRRPHRGTRRERRARHAKA